MVDEQRVIRALAWLMRNEGVEAEAIERAVASAKSMRLGEVVSLSDDPVAPMRRAFLFEQTKILFKS